MNDQEFELKLGELLGQIDTLPQEQRGALAKLAQETGARHAKLKQTIGNFQESLDELRLSVKYLVFDLEATRRENDYLRRLLADHAGDSSR